MYAVNASAKSLYFIAVAMPEGHRGFVINVVCSMCVIALVGWRAHHIIGRKALSARIHTMCLTWWFYVNLIFTATPIRVANPSRDLVHPLDGMAEWLQTPPSPNIYICVRGRSGALLRAPFKWNMTYCLARLMMF